MSNQKKNRLIPKEYDEVSLVDAGANQHAHTLIIKREEISKRPPPGEGGWTPTLQLKYQRKKPKKSKKNQTTNSIEQSRSRKKSRPKKRGTSQRARNWKEERHPREKSGEPDGGEFTTSSASSKKKYGKGGTTKAKLLRAKKVKPEKVVAPETKITHHVGGGSKAPAKNGKKKVSTSAREQVERLISAGKPMDLGDVSDEVWDLLKARGWTGRAGDNAERLYPPPENESDPEGAAERARKKGKINAPNDKITRMNVNKSSSAAKIRQLEKWMGVE